MLRTISTHLATQGHDITIWCEQPCYKSSDMSRDCPSHQDLEGVAVHRISRFPLASKIKLIAMLGKILFPLRILIKAMFAKLSGQKYDLVWTATIPPVVQGFVGRKTSKLFNAKFLYHCQDLYPEIANQMGLLKETGLFYRLIKAVEKRNRREADCLVTLSEDMAQTVLELQKPSGSLEIVNNFNLDDFDTATENTAEHTAADDHNEQPIRIIFAGNLGLFQGLDKIVDAARIIESQCPTIQILFLGEGKALNQLKRSANGLTNIKFQPHLPFAEAKHIIAKSDYGIVSIEPDIYRFAYPSKLLTYFGLGLPVLAIVEQESELAQMIMARSLGYVSKGRTAAEISDMLLLVAKDRNKINIMKSSVANTHQMMLKPDRRLQQWAKIIDGLENMQ
ncbi:MAG: glycosyltransferase family 4 protein [Parasphingorhabdus sp.]